MLDAEAINYYVPVTQLLCPRNSEHNKGPMMTKERLVARVVGDPPKDQKVKHYVGMPPELTDGVDTRRLMGWAAVLLIERKKSGVFLERFDRDGEFVGDTWHMSIDEAMEQAEFEYDMPRTVWRKLPDDIEGYREIVTYCMSNLAD